MTASGPRRPSARPCAPGSPPCGGGPRDPGTGRCSSCGGYDFSPPAPVRVAVPDVGRLVLSQWLRSCPAADHSLGPPVRKLVAWTVRLPRRPGSVSASVVAWSDCWTSRCCDCSQLLVLDPRGSVRCGYWEFRRRLLRSCRAMRRCRSEQVRQVLCS